ncbi:hypothetical protein ACYSNM_08590 [Myroides sp. LJL116]
MKLVYLIAVFSYFSFVCRAQDNRDAVLDSIVLNSRSKSDIVLNYFNTIKAPKLLYSIDDKYFYLIIKDSICYQEYYIDLDNTDNIKNVYNVKSKAKNKKQRKKEKEYKKLLLDADPIFDLDKYSRSLINNIPEAKTISGKLSYFVIQDLAGEKYGEFSLSSLTFATPIDYKLLTYLINRLSDEIANNKQGN